MIKKLSNRFKFIFFCFVVTMCSSCQGNERLLMPYSSPPAKVVDVINLVSSSNDERLAAITLQGKVNSGENSSVYIIIGENTNDTFWLKYFKEKGYIAKSNELTLDEYYKKYSSHFDEVIVYDQQLPVTMNIATMMASLKDAIVIAPDDIEKFSDKKVNDLRGRWKSNVDAYSWAFDNLWPEMNHDVLACYHPTFTEHRMRDYLIRHKIFTLWVTSQEKSDGVKSDFEKEKEFAIKVFKSYKPNTPVVGFWYSGLDVGLNEYTGVGLAGEYGMLTLPIDWSPNMSLISGIDVDLKPYIENYAKMQRQVRREEIELQNDKVYIAYCIMESGDSPGYWHGMQKKIWDDPNQGRVAISWTYGPTTGELMPAIMQWFYERMTPMDNFIMSLSGAGYVHPYRNFMGKTKNPEQAWKEYLKLTQQYMDMYEIDDIAIYTDAWRVFDREEKDPITLKFTENLKGLDSLIMGMGRDESVTGGRLYTIGKNDTIVAHIATRWDSENVGKRGVETNQWLIEEIKKYTPASRPAFVYVHPLSWSYFPSDLKYVSENLGDEYITLPLPQVNKVYKKYLKSK